MYALIKRPSLSKGKKACKYLAWLRNRARWSHAGMSATMIEDEPGEISAAERKDMSRPYLYISLWT